MAKTPYEILGVAETATVAEVKKAYRTLVKVHHPDKNGTVDGFTQIQKAYELLSDPKRRKAYDVLHGVVKDSVKQNDDAIPTMRHWGVSNQQYSNFMGQYFQQAMAQQATSYGYTTQPKKNYPTLQRPTHNFTIPRSAIFDAKVTTNVNVNNYGSPYIDEVDIRIDCSQFTEFPFPGDTATLEFTAHNGNVASIGVVVIDVHYSNSSGRFEGELRCRRISPWQTSTW